jgi:hypothetical protein
MFHRRLESDVPVTSRISWRSYQAHLTVRELLVRVLTPELQVMDPDAVVEFAVVGSLSPHPHGQSHWPPLIESLHISERFTDENSSVIGDIVIVPVAGIRRDNRYDNQPVEFRVTVQHQISSYRWGRNQYRVTCGHIAHSFEVIQFNKSGVLHDDNAT